MFSTLKNDFAFHGNENFIVCIIIQKRFTVTSQLLRKMLQKCARFQDENMFYPKTLNVIF